MSDTTSPKRQRVQFYFDEESLVSLDDLVAQGRIRPEDAALMRELHAAPPVPLAVRPVEDFIPPEVLALAPSMPTPVPHQPQIVFTIDCAACCNVTRISPRLRLPPRCTHCGRPWTSAQVSLLTEQYSFARGALAEFQGTWDDCQALWDVLLAVSAALKVWQECPPTDMEIAELHQKVMQVRQALEGEGESA
jgi:hypothetical protein